MNALRALIAAMPDICRALDQVDSRWQDQAFHVLVEAAREDARNSTVDPNAGRWTVSNDTSQTRTGYDPTSTTVMAPVSGYDPLGPR